MGNVSIYSFDSIEDKNTSKESGTFEGTATDFVNFDEICIECIVSDKGILGFYNEDGQLLTLEEAQAVLMLGS